MRPIDRSCAPIVQAFLAAHPLLSLQDGSRHARVVNRQTGDFVPVPGSSGDSRAPKHLKCALARLATSGRGLIAAKRGCGA